MSKHTPGPWFVDVKVNRHGGWKGATQEVTIYADRWIISAYSTESTDYPDDQENEANARLIASAPKMLETLQAVRDYVVTMKGVGHEYQVMIDSAIAKATGAAE